MRGAAADVCGEAENGVAVELRGIAWGEVVGDEDARFT